MASHFHSWTDIVSVIVKVCSSNNNSFLLFNILSRSVILTSAFKNHVKRPPRKPMHLLEIHKYLFRK